MSHMAFSVVESWAGWVELPSNKTSTNKTACPNLRCCNLSSGINASLQLMLCTTFGTDCHTKMARLTANSVCLAKCPLANAFVLVLFPLISFFWVFSSSFTGQILWDTYSQENSPLWEVLRSFLYDNNGGSYKNGIKTMELQNN